MDIAIPNLKATEFVAPPTEEELMNLLRDHKEFWSKLAAVLIATGKYNAIDQQGRMQKMFGMTVQLQMVIDALNGTAQIAVPQPHLVPRPQ